MNVNFWRYDVYDVYCHSELPDGFALHQHWSLLEVGVHKVFTCKREKPS